MDERLESVAHGVNDLRAYGVLDVLKDPPDRTEARDVAEQLRLGQHARDVDRGDGDVGPMARVENPADPIGVGERELSRSAGLTRRQRRQQWRSRALRG